MLPLGPSNGNELPVRPDTLSGVRFLSLFVEADRLPTSAAANGQGGLLRTYKAEPPLNLLKPPPLICIAS